jgi:hypothetical protein
MHPNETPILTPLAAYIQQMYTDLGAWVQEGRTTVAGLRTNDSTLELALNNPTARLLEVLGMEIDQAVDLKAFQARIDIIDLLHGNQCHPFFEYKVARSRELDFTGVRGDRPSSAFGRPDFDFGLASTAPPDGTVAQVFEDARTDGWKFNTTLERHTPEQVMANYKPDDGIYKWPFLRKLSDEALTDKIRGWWGEHGGPYKVKPEEIVCTLLGKAGVMLIAESTLTEMAEADKKKAQATATPAVWSAQLDAHDGEFLSSQDALRLINMADMNGDDLMLKRGQMIMVSDSTGDIEYRVLTDVGYSAPITWEGDNDPKITEEDLILALHPDDDLVVEYNLAWMERIFFKDMKVHIDVVTEYANCREARQNAVGRLIERGGRNVILEIKDARDGYGGHEPLACLPMSGAMYVTARQCLPDFLIEISDTIADIREEYFSRQPKARE